MNCSIFSNNLCKNRIVSLREVHECLDSTKTMRRVDRVEYFNSVGIDYDNVEKYVTIVERLNTNNMIKSYSNANTTNYIVNPQPMPQQQQQPQPLPRPLIQIHNHIFADFIQYLEYIRFCIRFCISVARD